MPYMQTIARSMADTGPMGGRYMPHAPPIVGRYGKRPHSRMPRLQLRTVRDLISSPRAFGGRAPRLQIIGTGRRRADVEPALLAGRDDVTVDNSPTASVNARHASPNEP